MSCLPGGNGSSQKKQKMSASSHGAVSDEMNGTNQPYGNNHNHSYSLSNHRYNNSNPVNSRGVYVNGYAHNHAKGNGTVSNGHVPCSMSSGSSYSGSRVPNSMYHSSANDSFMPDFPQGNSVSSYDMCVYCFDLLINKLKPDEVTCVTSSAFPYSNDSYPLFVTWKRIESDGKRTLRGCIGTFTETKLHKGLHDYALSSALKDSRFPPITEEEINKLVVSVSVLLNFEEADNWEDWIIGVHGLRIEIETDRGQKKTATYLPEVASEQHWNKKQTIDSLLQKSGYTGRINSDVRNRIKLTRYKSEKVTLTYSEYRSRKSQRLMSNGSSLGGTGGAYEMSLSNGEGASWSQFNGASPRRGNQNSH